MLIKAKADIKFGIIQQMTVRDNNLLNIAWLCQIAEVSRSGYYHWLAAEESRKIREEQDKMDFVLILEAYNHRGYAKGARGIYMRLLHENPVIIINIKKIRRLMYKYGLKCPIRKANPYRRMAKALRTNNVAPNLLNREFRNYGARAILLTDITYIPRKDGSFSYLSTVLDAYTKQLLAYALSDSLEVDFVLETINRLVENHGISLQKETMIHSDQGCHYTSYKFIQLVKNLDLRQSMSRKANCWDNAPQESFYGHMKDEIDLRACQTHAQVVIMIDDWMDYYNNDRYQWELAQLSPNEYYEFILTGFYPLSHKAPNNNDSS
jgi:putative transposase